ncbi:MAG: MotA/TolQ/ExbB proton channel family protein [Chitinispirillia bacterium]|jgi:biopolymer transport protein ExbB
MRLSIIFVLFLSFICFAKKKDKVIDIKHKELQRTIDLLNEKYLLEQNELKKVTEERWTIRQKMVTLKEENKNELEQFQQKLERFYSDVARAREELLARETAFEREMEILKQKQTEKDFMIQAINGKKDEETENNLISFPINQDTRMASLEKIERTYPSKKFPLQKIQALLDFKFKTIIESSTIGIKRRTFIPEDGLTRSVTAQVLRIGHCMAYAMPPDTFVYFLGSTGRLGKNNYEWNKITNPDLSATLLTAFPVWIKGRFLDGNIPVDILQNKYSSSLITSEKSTWKTVINNFLKAGGPILIPLALMVIWALILIVNKLIVFALKHRRSKKFVNDALQLLSEGKVENTRILAQKKKGLIATILQTCLNNTKWKRSAAEKSVKELLLTEVPKLDKHLDTLAVLAAAAPLMGLLGTVTGMIRMFEAITKYGTGDPKLLAGGISEALITTEVGLSIAIPILLIHNFLRNRRNRIQSDMEMYAMKILNRIWPED